MTTTMIFLSGEEPEVLTEVEDVWHTTDFLSFHSATPFWVFRWSAPLDEIEVGTEPDYIIEEVPFS